MLEYLNDQKYGWGSFDKIFYELIFEENLRAIFIINI